MYIKFDDMSSDSKCISRDGDMLLYIRADTKAENGYVYNIYSHHLGWESYKSGIISFHKKLKIYKCNSHGYYVVCQGKRMYVNGIVNGETLM